MLKNDDYWSFKYILPTEVKSLKNAITKWLRKERNERNTRNH